MVTLEPTKLSSSDELTVTFDIEVELAAGPASARA
jgi:hypothetical protein